MDLRKITIIVFLFAIGNYCLGYNHPLAFKNVDDEHIDKVEHFIKFQQDDSKSKIDLFGTIFANNPTQFQFMPGERLLIKELVKHVLQIVDNGGKNKGLHHFKKTTRKQWSTQKSGGSGTAIK